MNTVEIFLPLDTGQGAPIPLDVIEGLIAGLADRFGGATAFTRQPAQGLWKEPPKVHQDRIIVVEVMVEEVDREWWGNYRGRLEREFDQQKVLIRVTPCAVI